MEQIDLAQQAMKEFEALTSDHQAAITAMIMTFRNMEGRR